MPDGFHRSKVGPRLAIKGLATRRPLSLTSGRYFEAELERPVCLQVVAGPRFEAATQGRCRKGFKVAFDSHELHMKGVL
jgi:hypothetical protein